MSISEVVREKYRPPACAYRRADGSEFHFSGPDAQLFAGQRPNEKKPWNYERLELYADGGPNPTWIVATAPANSDHDYIQLFPGPDHKYLNFESHMLLLNGEVQNVDTDGEDEANAITTVGLEMEIFQSPNVPGHNNEFTTTLWNAVLGDGRSNLPVEQLLVLFRLHLPRARTVGSLRQNPRLLGTQ